MPRIRLMPYPVCPSAAPVAWGPAEEASLVARLLVDADLSGHDSHGVIQILATWTPTQRPDRPWYWFHRERETAATALVDGHWGFGHRLAHEAITLGIDKAHRCGISAVGAYRYHVGHLGAYVRLVAEAGMVGHRCQRRWRRPASNSLWRHCRTLADQSARRWAANRNRRAFILDISTSIVAEGQVRLKCGVSFMPLGWMIDGWARRRPILRTFWHDRESPASGRERRA